MTIYKTLTTLQKIMLVILGLGTIGSAVAVVVNARDQNWLLVLSWLTVILGIGLTWVDLGAFEYFRHQERLAGSSWLLRVFTRTALTVTLVCGFITGARALILVVGTVLLIPVLTGFFIIWLMLIPVLMQREFKDHEGR